MKGKCQGCGLVIDSDIDELCYNDTGHVTPQADKNGNVYPQPCGPITWDEQEPKEAKDGD